MIALVLLACLLCSVLLSYISMTMLLTNAMREMWSTVPGWWRSWFRYATLRRISDGTWIGWGSND